ncbi:hypothetical protein D3C81_1057170 [compost metagenome]
MLIRPMMPALQPIERSRPKRSASPGNSSAPTSWPTDGAAIRTPICTGVSDHCAISSGSVAAMAMTSKPSKKVARPISSRARICMALPGMRSMRATILPRVMVPPGGPLRAVAVAAPWPALSAVVTIPAVAATGAPGDAASCLWVNTVLLG